MKSDFETISNYSDWFRRTNQTVIHVKHVFFQRSMSFIYFFVRTRRAVSVQFIIITIIFFKILSVYTSRI